VGITPHADYLFNPEAKRMANENDYVDLYRFTINE